MATSVNGYAIVTSDVGRPYSIIKVTDLLQMPAEILSIM